VIENACRDIVEAMAQCLDMINERDYRIYKYEITSYFAHPPVAKGQPGGN